MGFKYNCSVHTVRSLKDLFPCCKQQTQSGFYKISHNGYSWPKNSLLLNRCSTGLLSKGCILLTFGNAIFLTTTPKNYYFFIFQNVES